MSRPASSAANRAAQYFRARGHHAQVEHLPPSEGSIEDVPGEVVSAPGGPSIGPCSDEGRVDLAANSNPPEEHSNSQPGAARVPVEDGGICVICLHECMSDEAIWSCGTCALVVHLHCMRSWIRESTSAQRYGRCPGCQQSILQTAEELTYTCWCRKVNWTDLEDVRGIQMSHSCGAVCGKSRPNGCPHRCTAVCHQDRCAPCGEMRVGVVCIGGHQTFEPFPCGSEIPPCKEPCGANLACGHTCAAPCHGGAHAPCRVPVSKFCSCPATAQVMVPCQQQVVQCESICTKMRACGSHRCGRRCHIGECAEQMVVSAWNKNAWINIGSLAQPPAAVAASSWGRPAAAAPAVSSADFPSLGGAPKPPAPVAASSPAAAAFPSCGKPCGRIRRCGHACVLNCHAGVVEEEDSQEERKEEDEGQSSTNLKPPTLLVTTGASTSSSTAAASTVATPALRAFSSCEAARCIQQISMACACGRKTAKLKCFESHQPATIERFQCDDTCRMHENGRSFFKQLEQLDEDGNVYGFKHLLPFSTFMLSSLALSASLDGNFLRKLETSVQKFVLSLCAPFDGPKSAAPSPHLYLSSLTPPRRQMVTQLAFWYNLRFDDHGGYLERISPASVQNAVKAYKQLEQKDDQAPSQNGVAGEISTALSYPSMSIASAAAIYAAEGSTAAACCAAETWPASLVLKLTFADEDTGTPEMARAPSLRRWFGSYHLQCRIILSTTRHVLVLFASPVVARKCYIHVRTHHKAELDGANVMLEAPAPTDDAREEIAEDELQIAELKREESQHRRQKEAEFADLRRREAEQRERVRIPSASVLKAAMSKPSVKVVRSEKVGLARTVIKSNNVFALLEDE